MRSMSMTVPRLDRQQVIGALKTTGSTDPDVLYARKEELLAETRKMKFLGLWGIVVGSVCTVTIFLSFIGIPIFIYGMWVRKKIRQNLKIAEAALTEYLLSIRAHPRSATA